MADIHLLTGVGGAPGNVSRLVADQLLDRGRSVRAMVHRDDGRADALRARGAEIVVGDLTDPRGVEAALDGVNRVFFTMAVSADYLEAATVMCALADENGGLEALVNMSQMTVSEMTSTSSEESHQQRLHWLSERVMNWSGLPVVHIRPTVFPPNVTAHMITVAALHAPPPERAVPSCRSCARCRGPRVSGRSGPRCSCRSTRSRPTPRASTASSAWCAGRTRSPPRGTSA